MKRKALLVGIDHYPVDPLFYCIKDAKDMGSLLKTHYDGSPNFSSKLLCSEKTPEKGGKITEAYLKRNLRDLFSPPADIALFYFSGHGVFNSRGGYIVTQDAQKFDEGLSFQEIIRLANDSPIEEIIIILDCCHGGAIGANSLSTASENVSTIRKGLTIIAASDSHQNALEIGDNGLFTSILLDALKGGAADTLGQVTMAGLYNYVDQLLGPWEQRPIYKSHVDTLTTLRESRPRVEKEIIRRITELFPEKSYLFPLDRSFEFSEEPHNRDNEAIFQILQQFSVVNLVEPVGEKHMYYAAINEKHCQLTLLGKFYWDMVYKGKI